MAIEKKVEDLSISANKTEKVVDDGPPKFKIRTLKKGSSTGTKPKKERILKIEKFFCCKKTVFFYFLRHILYPIVG